MGGFSVQCDCGKWFTIRNGYKDHCKGKGCAYHPTRVGHRPLKTPQNEARIILETILGRELKSEYYRCTGTASDCPIEECMLCGVRDCPGNEPLHYHHDGCPYCWNFK